MPGVKLGRNPYAGERICAYCRETYEGGGLSLRLQIADVVVDMPLCQTCLDRDRLYEGPVTFERCDRSFPLGLA